MHSVKFFILHYFSVGNIIAKNDKTVATLYYH